MRIRCLYPETTLSEPVIARGRRNMCYGRLSFVKPH